MDDYPNFEPVGPDRDASETKEVLARFVESIEGMDDEALHEVFASRAIKKATWSEEDLVDGLEKTIWKAEKTSAWERAKAGEEIDFDELFNEAASS